MNFKQFFESEDVLSKADVWRSKFIDISKENAPYKESERLEIAERVAAENGLPAPTEYYKSGTSATIYKTENPEIILRISSEAWNYCEKVIDDPEMQRTGGVNVVKKLVKQNGLLLSWKELVDTDWERHLSKYEREPLKRPVLRQLPHLYEIMVGSQLNNVINVLKTMPETKNLADALELGLPIKDLHNENLGFSLPGSKYPNSLQVIDC